MYVGHPQECPDTENVGLWNKQLYKLNAINPKVRPTIGIQFDAKPLLQLTFFLLVSQNLLPSEFINMMI